MEKFEIVYYGDFLKVITRVIVECNDDSEVNDLADKYYEENLAHIKNLAGIDWYKVKS